VSDKYEDFTADELEAFKHRELELQAEKESIINAIDDLGLKKMSRDDLEYLAAEFHIRLDNAKNELGVSNKLVMSWFRGVWQKFKKGNKGLIADAQRKAISQNNSETKRQLVSGRHANSLIGKTKSLIYSEWLDWQKDKSLYKDNIKFSDAMFDKYYPEDIELEKDYISNKHTVSEWCTDWGNGRNLPPTSTREVIT
jgi:hypothetical protein